MRLISQDGMIDVNYDNGSLIVGFGEYKDCVKSTITYYDKQSNVGTKIATYSSKDKAIKVMEMLQEEYRFEKLFETLCSGMGDYPNKPFYYFQFPQDEDVEV